MQTGDVLYFGSGTDGRLPYRHQGPGFLRGMKKNSGGM